MEFFSHIVDTIIFCEFNDKSELLILFSLRRLLCLSAISNVVRNTKGRHYLKQALYRGIFALHE